MPHTADYDPPSILVVVVMPGTHVTTTVQKFIVVVMPGTHVHTTLAKIYHDEEEEDEDPKSCFKFA